MLNRIMEAEKREKKVTAEFLIINIPAWMAFAGAIVLFLFFLIYGQAAGLVPKIALLVFTWQCLAATVMLLIDYKRKKKVYRRLLKSCDSRTKMNHLLKPLRGTLCGLAIGWAVKHRFKANSSGETTFA